MSIQLIRRRLARLNPPLEQEVYLSKRTVFGLVQAEEAPNRGQGGEGAPEKGLKGMIMLADGSGQAIIRKNDR